MLVRNLSSKIISSRQWKLCVRERREREREKERYVVRKRLKHYRILLSKCQLEPSINAKHFVLKLRLSTHPQALWPVAVFFAKHDLNWFIFLEIFNIYLGYIFNISIKTKWLYKLRLFQRSYWEVKKNKIMTIIIFFNLYWTAVIWGRKRRLTQSRGSRFSLSFYPVPVIYAQSPQYEIKWQSYLMATL